MKNVLDIFHNIYFFPCPVILMRTSFLAFNHENVLGFLEVKPMKVWSPPANTVIWDFCTLKLVCTEPPTIDLNYHLKVLTVYGSSEVCSRSADHGCDSGLICLSRLKNEISHANSIL